MIILVMGVSGSGKSTIAKLLADSLHWEFSDADNFHSPQNIDKMRRGISLDDGDRLPWLQDIQAAIKECLEDNQNVVLACSALKSSYRQYFFIGDERIKLVYLKGSFDLIQKRLNQRQNHFMSEKLLKSQFDSLEEPADALYVDISAPPEVIVQNIRESLGLETVS
ncbi:gluconate kinase [Fischerella thermalis CCMEE 5273]|jgi:gluconokinase|uniref:Gluconokinase n=1 Tax=Fischerella thermalis JSC-11 TaxID=741277 RepID=G6FWS8_9CYAN|nr:gluconokinase [Fischerella thermalis]PMB07554.1 gluconate kinase [Fischerella thermalis CCMEE 5273]EHC11093.1 carbohydrate kinase, thermoresistant glucokinase family [Fischerella thermalis JSC-11]PLZ07751.1 gluconate kinase [Fischerella thermalis WC119]PLZ13440.1 gluconate kinase [Fischerella thermalis WC114]PLZ19880.1 gluconate kinase [Fischerella thermalis WC157]